MIHENFQELEKISVLYVEDETGIRKALGELISRYFKEVYMAEDGRGGLELFEKHSPDLVMTDIKMPKMDGIELARRIRELSPEIPIVFLTSHDDTYYLHEAIRLKIDGYIIKPIQSHQLLEVCSKAVSSLLAKQALAQKDELMILQSRQAAMGEMISMIAHQWRQPLNSLALLNGKLMLLSEKEMLTQEVLEETVKRSEEILAKMSGTIDDFRNFFKPNKERVQVSIGSIMESVISLIGKMLEYARVDLVDKTQPEIELCTYPNELCQIVVNLISNAKEACIEKEVSNPLITVYTEVAENSISIVVEDNGGGIPEEIGEKAFEPYFTTKGVSGTGLGLYMCKMIVERSMQGNITIENIGEGLRCRISLPYEISD